MKPITKALAQLNNAGQGIVKLKDTDFFKLWVGSMLAGMYVGIAIIFIFNIGSMVTKNLSPIVMGATFGIALVLVVLAGSYLFTGLAFSLTASALYSDNPKWSDTIQTLVICWFGNLLGAIILAFLISKLNMPNILNEHSLLNLAATAKVSFPVTELIIRGFFCNLLVCLAVWMSARIENDVAKILVIWWCLFVFIACGFEHSVANMTLLFTSYFSGNSTIELSDICYNLGWVTVGNFAAAILLAAAYCKLGKVGATPQVAQSED